MNLPLIPSGRRGRIHWTAIAARAGLLLVGALTVINSVELTRLPEQDRADSLDAQVQMLATHVADLARHAEQARTQPETVSLARYDAERQTVEQRLAAIEQALSERPGTHDLQPLRDRLAQLEERLASYTAAQSAIQIPAPPSPPVRPKAAEPSFQVLGVERRADERFLVILAAGANSLAQARLLRVGDQENGWRLKAIEDETATFSQAGQDRRLNWARGKRP
ncbi:MAG: hypothetical protein LBT71_01045 [Azoarcus sp.]|jgi:hypothetical protein|nr:hypothetical protein [Azoarcus sp.]